MQSPVNSTTSSQTTEPLQKMPLSPNYRNVAPLSPNYRTAPMLMPNSFDYNGSPNKKNTNKQRAISPIKTLRRAKESTSTRPTTTNSFDDGSNNNKQKKSTKQRAISPIKALRRTIKDTTTTNSPTKSSSKKQRPKTTTTTTMTPYQSTRVAARNDDDDNDDDKQHSKKGFFRRLFKKNKKHDKAVADAPLVIVSQSESRSSASSRSKVGTSSRSKVSRKKKSVTPTTVLKEAAAGHQKSSSSSERGLSDQQAAAVVVAKTSESSDGPIVTGGIPGGVDEDRPELFYANDEVSALTDIGSSSFGSSQFVNSRSSRRGGDPSEESGESSSGDPVGKYWKKRESPTPEEQRRRRKAPSPTIDPFHELSFTKSLKEHHQRYAGLLKKQQLLQIIPQSFKVSNNMHDPTGDSPLQSAPRTTLHDPSPRGFQTPVFQEHPIQDPVGESPLHKNRRGPSELRDGSPFAPDPPLYLKSLDDEDSELVSEGSSVSSPEKKVDGTAVVKATSKNVATFKVQPSSSSLLIPMARIPRSPARCDGGSVKETIGSYSPRTVPQSPSSIRSNS